MTATVRAPPSKSATHRALLLAARSPHPVRVLGALAARDTQATLACLHALGARIDARAAPRPDALDVAFTPAPLRNPPGGLPCGESGTTLRLLAATCATLPGAAILAGTARLAARPHEALVAALGALGARATTVNSMPSSPAAQGPVLHVHGPLRSGAVTVDARQSSQPASALLLALPFVAGASVVRVPAPIASAGYLHLTLAHLDAAGLDAKATWSHDGLAVAIEGPQQPSATSLHVEGDWSAAAHLLVAAAAQRRACRITGLDPASRQPDRAIVELARSFGANVVVHDDGVAIAEASDLVAPAPIDVAPHPDLAPALAVLAAGARGTTRLVNAHNLRGKESDRLHALATGLRHLGVDIHATADALVIHGQPDAAGSPQPKGATPLPSFGDHRIHMALAALAPDRASDGDATKSYPGFARAMAEVLRA